MHFFLLWFKIEELKNENALLQAQLQQHGIEMVGETPPQWMKPKEQRRAHPLRHITDTVGNNARKKTNNKKTRDFMENHFIFSECILPWVPRLWTLHKPILAALDFSNRIEITTRCSWVEMCSKKRCPLTFIRVLYCRTSYERDPLLPFFICIYVASFMDYDVCQLFLSFPNPFPRY